MSNFRRAVKYEQKLRMALCGPTGSGKTYTMLTMLTELAGETGNGRVAVIDTEHGKSEMYADYFDFDVLELTEYDPRHYIQAIRDAEAEGYAALGIDSLSHAWMGKGGALEMVDQRKARQGNNNSFVAWRDVTPLHNQLVDAMLGAKMHIIATMRSKMEYVLVEKVREGRTYQEPQKVGMAPIQRDGVEYEFDVVGDMDINNTLVITKSRIFDLAGEVINKPGAEVATQIVNWLRGAPEGEKPAPPAMPKLASPQAPQRTNGRGGSTQPQQAALHRAMGAIRKLDAERHQGIADQLVERFAHAVDAEGLLFSRLTFDEANKLINSLLAEEKRLQEAVPAGTPAEGQQGPSAGTQTDAPTPEEG